MSLLNKLLGHERQGLKIAVSDLDELVAAATQKQRDPAVIGRILIEDKNSPIKEIMVTTYKPSAKPLVYKASIVPHNDQVLFIPDIKLGFNVYHNSTREPKKGTLTKKDWRQGPKFTINDDGSISLIAEIESKYEDRIRTRKDEERQASSIESKIKAFISVVERMATGIFSSAGYDLRKATLNISNNYQVPDILEPRQDKANNYAREKNGL